MPKKSSTRKKKTGNIFDAHLKDIDPELYGILSAAAKEYNSVVDLRPNTLAMLPHINEILTSKVLDQKMHETVASEIASITNFEFVNPIPESRYEAYSALLPLITDGNLDASIVYIKFLAHIQDGGSVSIEDYLKQEARHIQVIGLSPDSIDRDRIKQQILDLSPTLVIADLSMCPCNQDLSWIRAATDEVNAKLIVDISNCLGLAVAGLYPFYEKLADIVVASTFASMGGPQGAIVFSNKYASKLKPLMDVSEVDDINRESILAKLAAIRFASDRKNRALFSSMIKYAQVLSDSFRDLGYKTLCDSENYLVALELPDDMRYHEYVRLLALAGVYVEGGKKQSLNSSNSQQSADLLFLGTSAISINNFSSTDVSKIARIIDSVINPYPNQIKTARRAISEIVSSAKDR